MKNGSPSQTHTSLFIAHRVTFSQRCHQPWNFPSIFCQEMASCRDKREVGAGAEGRDEGEEVDWLHGECRERRRSACSWRALVCVGQFLQCFPSSPGAHQRVLDWIIVGGNVLAQRSTQGSGQIWSLSLKSAGALFLLQGTPQVHRGWAAGTAQCKPAWGLSSAGFGRADVTI